MNRTNTNLTVPRGVLTVEGSVPLEVDSPALEPGSLQPPVDVRRLWPRGLECADTRYAPDHPPLRGPGFEALGPRHRLVNAHFLREILLGHAPSTLLCLVRLENLLKIHDEGLDHERLEAAVTKTVLVVWPEQVGRPDDGEVAGGHPGHLVLRREPVQVPHHVGQGAPVGPGEPRHQLPQTRHLVAEGELGGLDEVLVEGERQQGLWQGSEVKLKGGNVTV